MGIDALLLIGVLALLVAIGLKSFLPELETRIKKQLLYRLLFVAVYMGLVGGIYAVGVTVVEMPDLVPFLIAALIVGVAIAVAGFIRDLLWGRFSG